MTYILGMRAPLCICNGVIRSGSTWSFNVCRELYQLAGQVTSRPVRSGYFEAGQLEHFINQQWAPMDSAVVIKSHDVGPAAIASLRSGTAKAVCTFRDPRDCVASDLAFLSYPFEVCVKRISGTLEPLRMFQSTPNILLVKYETMIANPRNEIRRIATHLGLSDDESVINFVDSKTNIETSKRLCESLTKLPAQQVLHLQDHIIDPTTHLHQNHINGGTVGRWKTELSNEQIAYTTEFFAPWLINLGYETPQSVQALINGAIPASPTISVVRGLHNADAIAQFPHTAQRMVS